MSDIFEISGSYNLTDNVSEKLKKVSKEVEVAGNEVTKSEGKFTNFSNKMNKIGEGLSKFGGNMTKFATVPILGAGVASFKLASDMDESMNKVAVACGESQKSVMDFSKTTLKQFGIAKGTTLDMVSTFADMGGGMGLSTQKASEMGMQLVGLAGDMASFKNVRIDVAQTALNGIYTGETESLKQLGIIMTETNLQEFALSKGIKTKVSEMTQAEKVNLRYAYVTEMSKNAVGDFARTNGGAANQTRMFGEGLKELGATIGTNLLPVITPIIVKMNEWVQKFGEMDPKTQKIILLIAGLVAIIGPLLMIIGSMATGFTVLAGVFGAITLPIIGIIAGIGLLIASIVYLWNTNEDFRNAIMNVWTSIKDFIKVVCDGLKAFWEVWGESIVSTITGFMDIVGIVFTTVFDVIASIFKAFTALFKGDWEGFGKAILDIIVISFNGLMKYMGSVVDWILGLFGLNLGQAVDIAAKIFNAIKYAITNPFGSAIDFIKWGIEKIKGFFNFNWSFPKLKMPHFSFSGSINPLRWGEEGVPHVGVEWYSKGGIFTQPTVLGNIGLGDADKGVGNKAEAVMPIEDLRGMIKDLLQVQIAMVVDGKEFVRQVVAPHNGEITEYNRQFSYS